MFYNSAFQSVETDINSAYPEPFMSLSLNDVTNTIRINDVFTHHVAN